MTHPLLADLRSDLDLDRAYADCARITRREARNFYYAFLPLKKDRRAALHWREPGGGLHGGGDRNHVGSTGCLFEHRRLEYLRHRQ